MHTLQGMQPAPVINVNYSGAKPAIHDLEVILQEWKKLPTDKKAEYKYISSYASNQDHQK